jgi:hypothetical protein
MQHSQMKTKYLFLLSIIIGFSCTNKAPSGAIGSNKNLHLETKEINKAFRDSIGVDSFIQLKDGFTYYELGGPDSGEVIVLVHG